MPSVSIIKNEREFYKDFYSLINILKTIAITQFHSLERKMQLYDEFVGTVESFFSMIDTRTIAHPFINPGEMVPPGIIAVTSDRGLLGGLNHRIMTSAFGYMEGSQGQLIVLGQQGQNFAQGANVPFKGFSIGEDDQRYAKALELREYVMNEVLAGGIGSVKVFYPYATSIQIQKVMELDVLPCTEWLEKSGVEWNEHGEDVLLESYPADLVEYLIYLLLGQRFFEILQFSRLAEFAARTVHLEDSAEKIKEIDKKLELKYFRARHEVIDQQMRELFSARSLYADKN